MAADLFEGIFNQILLKTTENDHFETIFPTLALSLPHILKTIGSFLIFYRLLIYRTWIRKIWLVLVHSKQTYAYPPPPPPPSTGRVNLWIRNCDIIRAYLYKSTHT